MASAPLGVTSLTISDPDADRACIAMDRAGVRRLIEDLELVAGLRPTAAKVPAAVALAGSARVLFERLAALDKVDPDAAAEVVQAIAAHLRAWRPLALVPGGSL